MEQQLLVIAIWATIALVALATLALAAFGLRNLASGKVRPMALVSMAVPAALVVILYFALDQNWVKAAIVTTLVMMVLAAGALVLAGVRGIAS